MNAVTLDNGEVISINEALKLLGCGIKDLMKRDTEAELRFRVLLALMTEFTLDQLDPGGDPEDREAARYSLEEAAQEFLVG
jgi:hypothetical protein